MLKRIQFPDQNMSLMQDCIDQALIPLQKSPLIGGKILSDISLTSAQDNLISHGLGYIPQLVLPFIPNVNTTIWSPTTASLNNTSASSKYINIRCSTTCTVSIWVV